MSIRLFSSILYMLVLCAVISNCSAKTRLSALHAVPHADFLDNSDITIDLNSYYFSDSASGSSFQPAGEFTYGITDWVNFEFGYGDGPTLGLKLRILPENDKWQPSIAIGIRNCITSKEIYYYDKVSDKFTDELYLAVSKSVEPVRLRIHLGVLSIPNSKREAFNPYIGLEKYFGGGVYTTFELHRRDHSAVPSVYASWRFLKRFELSAGVVSFYQMLFDEDNEFDAGISSSKSEGLVRPGFYAGLRFQGNIGRIGKKGGFKSLENRLDEQQLVIDTLRYQLDSLRTVVAGGTNKLNDIDSSLAAVSDSVLKNKDRYRTIAIEKLNSLRVFYSQEPFEPELVKKGYDEIVSYRNEMVPTLYSIVFDMGFEKKIRTLAVSVLGQIGTRQALDGLINILSQSKENEIKIETLICLGNNKETRAVYLMQQLANDTDDALAFTAAEVLKKLAIKIEKQNSTESLPVTIPEQKISERKDNSAETKKQDMKSTITNDAKKVN